MKMNKKIKVIQNTLMEGANSEYIVRKVREFLDIEFPNFEIITVPLLDAKIICFKVEGDIITMVPFFCDLGDKVKYSDLTTFNVIFKSKIYKELTDINTHDKWTLESFEEKKDKLTKYMNIEMTDEDAKFLNALFRATVVNISICKFNNKMQKLLDSNTYGKKIRDILIYIQGDGHFYNMVEIELSDGKYEEMMLQLMMDNIWVTDNVPTFEGASLFADVGLMADSLINKTAAAEYSRKVESLVEQCRVIPSMFEINDKSTHDDFHLYFSVEEFNINLDRQYKLLESNIDEILFNLWKVYSIINLKNILGEELCK